MSALSNDLWTRFPLYYSKMILYERELVVELPDVYIHDSNDGQLDMLSALLPTRPSYC